MISEDFILRNILREILNTDTKRTYIDFEWNITHVSEEDIDSEELNMIIPLCLSSDLDNPYDYPFKHPCYFSPAFYDDSLSERVLREEWHEKGVRSISISHKDYKRLTDRVDWEDNLEYLKHLISLI